LVFNPEYPIYPSGYQKAHFLKCALLKDWVIARIKKQTPVKLRGFDYEKNKL